MKSKKTKALPFLENIIMVEDASKLLAEGITSIGTYNSSEVILKMKKYSVKITGTNLNVRDLSLKEAEVVGNIFNITFLYE
jgi:hypothetical protein